VSLLLLDNLFLGEYMELLSGRLMKSEKVIMSSSFLVWMIWWHSC